MKNISINMLVLIFFVYLCMRYTCITNGKEYAKA